MANTNKIPAISETETRKYLVINAGTDSAVQNAWYYRCKKAKIPWVVVTKKRKSARIDVDLFTMADELDDVIRAKRVELRHFYRELFHRYATKKSSCGPAPSGPFFYDMPIDIADDLAEELIWFVNRTVRLVGSMPCD
jgi:hypothetical protein